MQARSTLTVCHVLHSLHYGGAEVLARQFARGMQREFRPVFACLDEIGPMGRQLRDEGCAVCVLERRPGFDARCAWRLRRWLNVQRVSLIHAHQYAPFFYASLARTAMAGTPVLFTEHGRDYPDRRRWKRVWANKFLLRRRDHVVAVGGHVRQALIDNEGLAPDRVQVIYNGVDIARFCLRPAERAAVRAELGYTNDHALVVQVARLNRLKDYPTAIRAAARLRTSLPQVRLLIIGDGEERGALESLVDELELRGSVRFLGTRGDVPRLLQAADAFLLSSVSEGIPLTLVEAMLSGVPVVATRVGGVPEVIEDGATGLLAEPGSDAGLAACLVRLLGDPELGHRLAAAGRTNALQRFAEDRMLAGYRQLYIQMMGGVPAPVADALRPPNSLGDTVSTLMEESACVE